LPGFCQSYPERVGCNAQASPSWRYRRLCPIGPGQGPVDGLLRPVAALASSLSTLAARLEAFDDEGAFVLSKSRQNRRRELAQRRVCLSTKSISPSSSVRSVRQFLLDGGGDVVLQGLLLMRHLGLGQVLVSLSIVSTNSTILSCRASTSDGSVPRHACPTAGELSLLCVWAPARTSEDRLPKEGLRSLLAAIFFQMHP
jgi:hypothetical protein